MDRVARRPEALQRMELCASKVHILRTPGLIETIQQAQNATLQTLVDPARPALAPKLGHDLMLKGPYHFANVI